LIRLAFSSYNFITDKCLADLNLPKFSPKHIKVLEKYMGKSVLKVSARGQVMCCKVADDRTHPSIDREFHCLQRVSTAGFDPPLRIPRLCGVIESGNDTAIGILITNITPNPEIPRLGLIDISTVALSRRKKWASQIEEVVEKLHDIGVIWVMRRRTISSSTGVTILG